MDKIEENSWLPIFERLVDEEAEVLHLRRVER
jgi:hypothetical protein